MISYIKALDFKLRKDSKYSKKQAIAAYLVTYLVVPIAMLSTGLGFLPLLAVFFLLRNLLIKRIRPYVISDTSAAVTGLTYMWVSVMLLISAVYGVYSLSQHTALQNLQIAAGTNIQYPEIAVEVFNKIAFGLALALMALTSFLELVGNFVVSKKLKSPSIKGIKTSELFTGEKEGGLNKLHLAARIPLTIYGVLCIAACVFAPIAIVGSAKLSVIINAFDWIVLTAIFYLAYKGKLLNRLPTRITQVLSVAIVLLDISLIAGLFGALFTPVGIFERVSNLVISLPLYITALWYSFLYLPSAKKNFKNKDIFV
jgi:hypothetical protein